MEDKNENEGKNVLNPINQLKKEISAEINEGKQEIATKIDGVDENKMRREFLDQTHSQKLPSNKDFEWSDSEKPGNSSCRLKDEASITIYSKADQQKRTITGKEFNEHMKETYGRDTVDYVGKEPDFSPFEQAFSKDKVNHFLKEKYGDESHSIESENDGHVEVTRISEDRRVTQSEASSIISDKLGISKSDLSEYMKYNNLTWHECGDGKTVRCVPTEINSVYGHTGGIGLSKDTKAVGTVFREENRITDKISNEEISAQKWVEDNKEKIKDARQENDSSKNVKDNSITKATNVNNKVVKGEVEKNNSIARATKKETTAVNKEKGHEVSHEK